MNILVIAAHPDDETLGAGCAIARHADDGDRVHILIMAAGLDSRDGSADASAHAALHDQARKAARILGAVGVEFVDFPDNAMDTIPLLTAVKRVEQAIAKYRPHTIYSHTASDLNIDHVITARAVMTAARPLPGAIVRRILAFEVPSASGWDAAAPPFRPNMFLNAEGLVERKLSALAAYEGEMRPFPHARSMEGVRARHVAWGAQVGFSAAEPYELVRDLRG